TGEPEVLLLRWASQRFRDEVIQLQGSANNRLGGQAVAAAMARLLGHAPAQLLGDVGAAHWLRTRQETSCPRWLRRAAAWARTSRFRSYCRTRSASVCLSDSVNPSRCCLRCSSSRESVTAVGR